MHRFRMGALMKFHSEDNGNCRIYYRAENRALYCYQFEGRQGWTFNRCSQDGEPSHQVREPQDVPTFVPSTNIGREYLAWQIRRGKQLVAVS